MQSLKMNTTKKARKAYGPEATDVTEDVPANELEVKKTQFLTNHVNATRSQIQNIAAATFEQSLSGIWHSERKKRLTASNFGCIVKRNASLPISKLVKSLLYSKFMGNRHTRNGLLQERSTIEEYKMKKAEQNENITVESSGLVVDSKHNFLAASPDGIVRSPSDTGLIEIKNLLHSKPLNLYQAAETPSFCLLTKDGSLSLKRNHNYYYQCQGLVNICDMEWIDFVVRTLNPYQLFIERIYRDKQFWNDVMLPKLQAFYFTCLLPELACPREGKCPGIREPGIWFDSPTHRSRLSKSKRTDLQKGKSRKTRRRRREDTSLSDSDSCTDIIPGPSLRKSTRRNRRNVKLLGRRINHEWVVDEEAGTTDWYKGTVLSVLSGKDGDIGTVYEVLYDGDEEPFEIDHLIEDLESSSVKFLDI